MTYAWSGVAYPGVTYPGTSAPLAAAGMDPGTVTDHRAWVATLAIPANTL